MVVRTGIPGLKPKDGLGLLLLLLVIEPASPAEIPPLTYQDVHIMPPDCEASKITSVENSSPEGSLGALFPLIKAGAKTKSMVEDRLHSKFNTDRTFGHYTAIPVNARAGFGRLDDGDSPTPEANFTIRGDSYEDWPHRPGLQKNRPVNKMAGGTTALTIVDPAGKVVALRNFRGRLWRPFWMNGTTIACMRTTRDTLHMYLSDSAIVIWNLETNHVQYLDIPGAHHDVDYNSKTKTFIIIRQHPLKLNCTNPFSQLDDPVPLDIPPLTVEGDTVSGYCGRRVRMTQGAVGERRSAETQQDGEVEKLPNPFGQKADWLIWKFS